MYTLFFHTFCECLACLHNSLVPRVRRHNITYFGFSESSVISLIEKNQDNSGSLLWYSLMYWTGFPLLNYLKWSLLLTLIGLLIGKCLVLFLRYLLFWYLVNNSFKNSILIYFTICFHGGFDNNGAIIGPRSTRHSNPEEHATYYFTTFSKELLVQVMDAFISFFGYSVTTVVTQQITNKTESFLKWINLQLKGWRQDSQTS